MKAWIPCLKFRTKCQFGKCATCVKYKQLIKEALIVEVRVYWTNGYTKHLTSQYADRADYYQERESSKLTSTGHLTMAMSTVCIIIDAMDQAKFACPRHLPEAKSLQDAVRPRLHVVGVRVAGFFNMGFLMDPTISKDGDVWIEVICEVL